MQIKHGELYWIDLRPVVDSYILCKVFNYCVFSDVFKPWFVHIYDCFSSDKKRIPTKKERSLYMYPINVSDVQVLELPPHFHNVGVEDVTEDERVSGIKVIMGVSFETFIERHRFTLLDVDSSQTSKNDLYTKEEVAHLGFLGRDYIYYIRDRIFIEYFKKNGTFHSISDEFLTSPSEFDAKLAAYEKCILYSDYKDFYDKPKFIIDPNHLTFSMTFVYKSDILRVRASTFFNVTVNKLKPYGLVPTAYLLLNFINILFHDKKLNFQITLPKIIRISTSEFRLAIDERTASILSEIVWKEIMHKNIDIDYYLNHPKINTFRYQYNLENDEKYLVEYEEE